jgi:methyl-accepting chemotaxis protein
LQAAAHEIDEQYISFRGSTDKVVMSLQSEDIARQRIEHVQEALHRVATLLSSGEKVESCAGVLAMQRSQLLSTRELLANSVQAIHQGLEALGPRIQELVSRTATLAQQTGEDGQSFASVIDAELGNVSNVFQHCSSSVNAVVTIVKNVMPSVEKMTEGACALENIEASIRLVSLNAAIKAAHLEQEGLGMGVIASELQTINLKSEADTNLVLENLAAIKEALARINREETVSEGSLMMGDNNVVTSQLAGLSSSVRTVSQQVTAGLDEVKRLAEVLCSEVKLGCDQARRAEVITQLFDDQVRAFDEAVSQFGYMSEMASTSADRGHGGDISTLYSMESERKLHQEIFGKDAAMVEETPAPSPSGSEFGDDIELF